MKVLVLGGGVIGVTWPGTSREAGHEVTVMDRQPAPALETSFANAGEVSPGYSAPWAGPGVPVKAIKWLLMRHRPLVHLAARSTRLWRWLVQMLANCTEAAYALNKAPHGAAGGVLPRLPERTARRDRHRLRPAHAARCSSSARRSRSTTSATTSRC